MTIGYRKGELLVAVFLLGALLCGCSGKTIHHVVPTIADGRYDLAFPHGESSEALNAVLETVNMLNVVAYYQTFWFEESESVTIDMVDDRFLKGRKSAIYQDVAVGTATTIYYERGRVAVLTCAHVVNTPDTVIQYFPAEEEETVIQQLAIKRRQENGVAALDPGGEFEILAMNAERDIAILGKSLSRLPTFPPRVFNSPVGKSRDLDWATFLYLIGFPSGKKMITTAIVSNPDRNREHDFLVDALFNRGFSGGIVLAVRDGIPNYELVGIVNAVAAENEAVLVPDTDFETPPFGYSVPYDARVFASSTRRIKYGITYGISTESILKMLDQHRDVLRSEGYERSQFFK